MRPPTFDRPHPPRIAFSKPVFFAALSLALGLASASAWGDDPTLESTGKRLQSILQAEKVAPRPPANGPAQGSPPLADLISAEEVAAEWALVRPIMEKFLKAPRTNPPSDYAYADSRYAALPDRGGREDLPMPGKNMPHFNFGPLLEWYAMFGKDFALGQFLYGTVDVLWRGSRRFGEAIDWSRVRFAFGATLGKKVEALGGHGQQTIIWPIPHDRKHPAPPEYYHLIHELTHVYQYQNGWHSAVGILFQEQISKLWGQNPYDFGGSAGLAERIADPERADFGELGGEEGADIIMDYALLKDARKRRLLIHLDQLKGAKEEDYPRLLAQIMDKSLTTEADAETLFQRLEHYAKQVLPEAKRK